MSTGSKERVVLHTLQAHKLLRKHLTRQEMQEWRAAFKLDDKFELTLARFRSQEIDSAKKALLAGFSFSTSPQGSAYWVAIYQRLLASERVIRSAMPGHD